MLCLSLAAQTMQPRTRSKALAKRLILFVPSIQLDQEGHHEQTRGLPLVESPSTRLLRCPSRSYCEKSYGLAGLICKMLKISIFSLGNVAKRSHANIGS